MRKLMDIVRIMKNIVIYGFYFIDKVFGFGGSVLLELVEI